MMRQFSVRRRRPHIVDFFTPLVPGVTGYRIQWAPNFTGPWATFLTAPNVGYLDPMLNPGVVESQPTGGQVRVVFDPANFLIPDDVSFWLRMMTVVGAVESPASSATLILPDGLRHGQGFAVIHGTAPNLPVIRLDLPVVAPDLRITNESAAASLMVGCELNGPLMGIAPKTTQNLMFQGTLYLAGNGTAVDFSASFAPTLVVK